MLRSLINQRLGRYYIKELLGRGGMAAVYRATDTVLQRDVALKVLYPHLGDDAGLARRFQREAVTAAALEHPNIVPVYDVGEHDGMAYIAMQLLSGRTLQDRLQEAGVLSLEELLRVLTPVAAALDYAHARGIVHRDVKPGNIFLSDTPDGQRVILTDFGIAKQLDTPGLTTTGAMIGTPDYMAPEQIAGRPVDARADIYALGMLAYRALAGRRAYEGSTQDVLLGHLYNRPEPPSRVNPLLPPAVDAVIDQATAREAGDRFASAGAFVAALGRAAIGAPAATAVGVPPALMTPPPSQRPTVPYAPIPAAATTDPPAPVVPPLSQQPTTPYTPIHVPPHAQMHQRDDSAALTASGDTPIPQAPPRGSALPWLAAIMLALIAGGLGVALLFAMRSDGGPVVPTSPPPPIPPTEAPSITAAPPPSPTSEPGGLATATLEPSPSETAPPLPTATFAPTAITAPTVPLPPTVPAPPTPTATLTPTETPSPSATLEPSPTFEPSPTATSTEPPVVACDTSLLKGGFGRVYDDSIGVRTKIGCPRALEVAGTGSQQFFERGMMFYWDNTNRTANADYIYVFYGRDEGVYEELTPSQVSALGPDPTPGPDPNQPLRGFGRVYFYKPGARERLGTSLSPEIELSGPERTAAIQFFDKGMMIFTPLYQPTAGRSIFVLYNDASFERFDDTFGG